MANALHKLNLISNQLTVAFSQFRLAKQRIDWQLSKSGDAETEKGKETLKRIQCAERALLECSSLVKSESTCLYTEWEALYCQLSESQERIKLLSDTNQAMFEKYIVNNNESNPALDAQIHKLQLELLTKQLLDQSRTIAKLNADLAALTQSEHHA